MLSCVCLCVFRTKCFLSTPLLETSKELCRNAILISYPQRFLKNSTNFLQMFNVVKWTFETVMQKCVKEVTLLGGVQKLVHPLPTWKSMSITDFVPHKK